MSIIKRRIIVFITVLLATILISCGVNDSDDESLKENNVDALVSDKTILTLGIIDTLPYYTRDYATQFVIQFNKGNENYHIEVVTYTGDDLSRLRTELMSGKGPDILYSLYYDSSTFTPLINSRLLVDLLPFFDADPDIEREDFFPKIFQAMQSPDGSLYLIANQFWIPTLISKPEIFSDSDSFTNTKFFDLIHSAIDDGMFYPMGAEWSRYDFLRFIFSYVDLGFIDVDNGVSNFESQAFYDYLNLALTLPIEVTLDPDFSLIAQMTKGEQIFKFVSIQDPNIIAVYDTLLGDYIIIGIPSDEGGIHGVNTVSNIAINANSDNQDAAWLFLRRFLLPGGVPVDTSESAGLPVRVDIFDKQIQFAMTRVGGIYFNDAGIQIKIDRLTEEGAQRLREVIDKISFLSRPNDTITDIIMEELPPFFAGNRSAEEVARVVQNRVQKYLDERN